MYRTQVRARSAYSIEKALGKWIFRPQPETPFLGSRKLDKLTVADFNKLFLAMAQQHSMEYRGIEHLHGLLRRALKHAVRTGELRRNPTDFATLPKPDVRAEITCEADEDDAGEVKSLSLEQVKRFLEAASRDRWSALWHLLLDAGLRAGEAFALQWRHVDFERGVVRVRGTLARVRGVDRTGREQAWIITKPKTKASIGDVPLRADTLKELRRWKAQQAEQRLLMGPEWQDHGFVFRPSSARRLATTWGGHGRVY
jgi:integrase